MTANLASTAGAATTSGDRVDERQRWCRARPATPGGQRSASGRASERSTDVPDEVKALQAEVERKAKAEEGEAAAAGTPTYRARARAHAQRRERQGRPGTPSSRRACACGTCCAPQTPRQWQPTRRHRRAAPPLSSWTRCAICCSARTARAGQAETYAIFRSRPAGGTSRAGSGGCGVCAALRGFVAPPRRYDAGWRRQHR